MELTVIPPVFAEPEALSFNNLRASSATASVQAASQFVLIKQVRGPRLEIKNVSATLPFIKVAMERAVVSGQVYQLRVELDPEKLAKGDYKGQIRVETNSPETPVIEIPVTVVAQ